MSLFGTLFGGKSAPPKRIVRGAPFLAGLASYPPWQLPHPGPSSALNDAQLDTNLAWLMDHLPERLAAVRTLLRDVGVDPAPLLDAQADGAATMAAIQDALEQELPEAASLPATRDPAADFRAHGGIGERIFFAFAADLGVLVGEAVRLRWPGTRWIIARDPQDIGSPYYRAIVLATKASATRPEVAFDMLGATIESLYELRREGVALRPDLSELLTSHL